MKNAILLFGGLVAAAWLFILYDWLASWYDRRSEQRGA
jgi:uncharacterized metal-binding protein